MVEKISDLEFSRAKPLVMRRTLTLASSLILEPRKPLRISLGMFPVVVTHF